MNTLLSGAILLVGTLALVGCGGGSGGSSGSMNERAVLLQKAAGANRDTDSEERVYEVFPKDDNNLVMKFEKDANGGTVTYDTYDADDGPIAISFNRDTLEDSEGESYY